MSNQSEWYEVPPLGRKDLIEVETETGERVVVKSCFLERRAGNWMPLVWVSVDTPRRYFVFGKEGWLPAKTIVRWREVKEGD
jgi:hypothetical protein